MVGSLPVMVLDADGDWDGDGHTNGAEELAGTDATDPVDVLRLYTMPAEAPDGPVAIFWLSLEGRRYTLLHTPELTPGAIDWQPVPGHTEAPGTGGLMVHIPDTSANPRGFYRLLVEWAE